MSVFGLGRAAFVVRRGNLLAPGQSFGLGGAQAVKLKRFVEEVYPAEFQAKPLNREAMGIRLGPNDGVR